MPGYDEENRFAAIALQELGELAWARTYAERAVAQDPKIGVAHLVLGQIVHALEGPAAAVPHYTRALEDARIREEAFNARCGALIDARQTAEAGRCVDDLPTEFPKNPEGWRQRLMVIGYDAPGSKEAMERSLALNDPERWSYHADAAAYVRKVLASQTGEGSPDDIFEGRVLRAKALEGTVDGRDYVGKLVKQPENILEVAFNACQAARTAGIPIEFTAVMTAGADGKLTDVAVRPKNAWSSCFAKQLEAHKVPAPPAGVGEGGYPLFYELRMR